MSPPTWESARIAAAGSPFAFLYCAVASSFGRPMNQDRLVLTDSHRSPESVCLSYSVLTGPGRQRTTLWFACSLLAKRQSSEYVGNGKYQPPYEDAEATATNAMRVKKFYQTLSRRAKELVARDEGADVDWKQTDKFDSEDIVAFANSFAGGAILLGVAETKGPNGRQVPKIIGCDSRRRSDVASAERMTSARKGPKFFCRAAAYLNQKPRPREAPRWHFHTCSCSTVSFPSPITLLHAFKKNPFS